MIHVVKDFNKPPEVLKSKEVQDSLKLILNGDKKAIKSDLYRGKTTTSDGDKFLVVKELMTLYNDKCAYCDANG